MLRNSLFALVLFLVIPIGAGAETDRPDVVVILADDLGYGDLGCYNSASKIPTPNLDRLAAEGMRFLDAHSPSAVCSPTRYGLLTGRYCWRTRLKSGVLWGTSPSLIAPERTTLPMLFRAKGYRTACVGKWHLGFGDAKATDYTKPLRPGVISIGFDSFFGIPSSLDIPPYLYVKDESAVGELSTRIEKSAHRRQKGGGYWREGKIAPGFRHADVLDRLADEAIDVLTARRSPAQPVFLYLPLTAPHTPWLPHESFRRTSGAGYYGDFVVHVDAAVGRVLSAIESAGRQDDTLVVFTSDNGAHWYQRDIDEFGHRANRHLRGQKADIWEGGHRVPFLVRWPGRVRPGTTSNQLVCLTDIFATCAELLGEALPPDSGEDSFSFLARLEGGVPERPRRTIVHHSLDGMFAIRDGRWKLILGLGSGGFSAPRRVDPAKSPNGTEVQLYDLASDPSETLNRARERPEIADRLQVILEGYRTSGRSRP